MNKKPLAIDLFAGLGGWTDGLLAENWDVIGFDIEQHQYGEHRYPAQLVIQDVLTLHGSQFRAADLIVASPPCQEFSYMAMPWSKAKAKRAAILADESGAAREKLTALFDACFRIQREACEAAGRHIPMIVENVRGANEWVGRSRWNYGSFHFWGDVPALMPPTAATGRKVPGFRFDGSGKSFQTASVQETGRKSQGMNWSDQTKRGQDFTRLVGKHCSDDDGRKIGGDWLSDPNSTCRRHGSKSKGRKMASAMIAKIPLPLSRHIAATFRPSAAVLREELPRPVEV
jgi:hypothetical protein